MREIIRCCLHRYMAAVVALLILVPVPVSADSYPSRPIRFIVPFAAGGGVDVFTRFVSKRVGEILDQSVIVENRVGGGGIVGADVVAKSAPDGYTFLITTSGQTILPSLSKLPWDPVTDFAPVTMGISYPLMFVVNEQVPVKSLAELIALAKQKPGTLNFGTGGVGTSPHLAMELLMTMTGTKFQHIAYRGNAPATLALVAGETQVGIDTIASLNEQIRAGKLRPLAITSKRRLPAFPDVPTVSEAGVPTYNFEGWTGVFAPRNTPKEYVVKISRAIKRAMQDPEITKFYTDLGYEIVGDSPEEFSRVVIDDLAKIKKIVTDAGIAKAQ